MNTDHHKLAHEKQTPQNCYDPSGVNSEPAIEARGFSLSYRPHKGNQPLQALHDVNLTVTHGETITIVGPSGCGKTTLLRAVAGLLTRQTPNVTVDGALSVYGLEPAEAKKRRLFAFAFQNPVLLPWRSVRQNVSLPLEIVDNDEGDASVVEEMISMVGIGDFARAMPLELSGGMQQRVNLARALVQQPSILLMDEPFRGLDEVTRERLNFELLRIQRVKNYTVVFVTHSITEAVLLADRVVVVSNRPGTVRDILTIDLPKERTEGTLLSPEYLSNVRKVREVFAKARSDL